MRTGAHASRASRSWLGACAMRGAYRSPRSISAPQTRRRRRPGSAACRTAADCAGCARCALSPKQSNEIGNVSTMPDSGKTTRPRLLIEDWLPAAAIGVECIRERSTGQQPPDKRFHVWWARRPLVASRAAVLASVLPADFPRDVFERLMGFWGPTSQIVAGEALLIAAKASGAKIVNPHGPRAFRAALTDKDLSRAHAAATRLWGYLPIIMDPMAGGGSIPLESTRLGFPTLANEYNPVACSVLEATLDYPFRFGPTLADQSRKWGSIWRQRFVGRMERFFPLVKDPTYGDVPPLCYIFA